MYSVKNSYKEFIIKKSKFLTFIYKVDSKKDIDKYLEILKKEYKDATHICFAYILDNLKKCSDDGEPSKTAGLPILSVLEGNNLNHVLCVVVRYFGGIKLGANGLIRAYGNCCKNVINNNIINIELGKKISIWFNYDKTKIIDNLLINAYIKKKDYDFNVHYEFEITDINYAIVCKELNNNIILLSVLENCFIEK